MAAGAGEFAVNDLPALGAPGVAEVAHRGEENCGADLAAADLVGFVGDFGHPDGILGGIKAVEGRGVGVELVAEHEDEVAQGRRGALIHGVEGFEIGVVRSGQGGPLGGVEHALDAPGAFRDEVGDEGGFGEIFPILLGHLRLHGADFDAGGIEDVFVIGAPQVVEDVAFGSHGAGDSGGEVEPLAVPVGALVGR